MTKELKTKTKKELFYRAELLGPLGFSTFERTSKTKQYLADQINSCLQDGYKLIKVEQVEREQVEVIL